MSSNTIRRFTGEHEFLSNFAPSVIPFDGGFAATVEHAFQASKTLDPAERVQVLSAATPGRAKRLGRAVTLRSDWDELRLTVMKELLAAKFQNSRLRRKLLATEDALLVEGNTWGDTFWGVDLHTGAGENHLGLLLMAERDRVRTTQFIL